ncbi:cellulose synthase subunit BcsC-related outer membrane protein [Novacetimonas pomaceti]|uniref:Cellulose synthase n=1 Tax=Novacetimonas pomaceti TaxID=2021998 RepID=A0A318Q9Z5_9PROT|nr:cellulose synthase subunit BcsC-related outer membrane protein [Novacetimonas pomaceti]PYD76486.1 cellulose synthase [Novacetimonas pomaceti]
MTHKRYASSLSAGLLATTCATGLLLQTHGARAQNAAAQTAAGSTTMTQAATVGAAGQGSQAAVVERLIQQARFWMQQQQYDNARQSLQSAARLAPDSIELLEAQGEYQSRIGNRDAALDTQRRLHEVAPGSTYEGQLNDLLHEQSISQPDLAHARSLAASGHSEQAVEAYQHLFNGPTPTPSLAVEYYQTLAGVQGQADAARDGLVRLVKTNPSDFRAQLALAQVLTYQPATRMEGLQRLQALEKYKSTAPVEAATAEKSYRQTLSWLPVTPETLPLMQQWLDAHPSDTALRTHMTEPAGGPPDKGALSRQDGFKALNAGRLSAARASFESALKINPKDADALGGMGLVAMRAGQNEEAHRYLEEAVAADPKSAAHWRPALAGLAVGEQYEVVRRLIANGQNQEAEQRLMSLARQPGQAEGATLMLADLQRNMGQTSEAERNYRAVLARNGDNPIALMGLARVLMGEGQENEANALLSRVGNRYSEQVGQIEVSGIMAEAARTSDSAQKVSLLRQAMTRAPNDPWLRINLANALQQQGDSAEAASVMQPLLTNPRTPEDYQAAILYASGNGNDVMTRRLLAGLSPEEYSPAIRTIADEMAIKSDLASRLSMVSNPTPLIREALAVPDPSGARGVAVADLFRQRGDMLHAHMALRIASTRSIDLTTEQRLAYATEYMKISNPVAAARLLAPLGDGSGTATGVAMAPEQRQTLMQLRMGISVAQSDLLNQRGDQASAYDHLAPALQADPQATSPRLALARLYNGRGKYGHALEIDLAVLRHNPQDLDARQAAVQAATNDGKNELAMQLAQDGVQQSPMDARSWLGMAVADRAVGHGDRTLADLRRAYELRLQQLQISRGEALPSEETQATAPPSSNPFRHDAYGHALSLGAPPGENGYSSAGSVPEVSDQMLSSINGQIRTLSEDMAPSVDAGLGFRVRSGTRGMGALTEASVPIVGRVPLQAGTSALTFTATPTFLTSGHLPQTGYDIPRFGTNLFAMAENNNSHHRINTDTIGREAGVAPDVRFANNWVSADVGASPLGFTLPNVIGGVEFAPRVGPVTFRVSGERRSITNSVLSYGGMTDALTGKKWGGVVTNHFHGQVEATLGNTILYGGGGYAIQTGHHVQSNTEVEGGLGANTLAFRNRKHEVRVGVNLTYFGYKNNQDFYTYGQGGYFSPQSYFAATVPVRYSGHSGLFDWDVTGSIGYQLFHEHSSAFFPTNPLYQALANAMAGVSTATLSLESARYPGDDVGSLVGGFDGRVGYRVSRSLRLDLSGRFQKAGNWDEGGAMISAHYLIMDQ